MAQIRTITAGEMDACLDLSAFAFQYELSSEEREQKKEFLQPEWTWGAFVNGELSAKLNLLPLQVYIQGRAFAMGGIAGVATWPEYRRQGLVAQLLRQALAVMKERGQTVSFLHPFSFPFYRKYGWETYTEYKLLEADFSMLALHQQAPDNGSGDASPGFVRRVSENQWQLLHEVYDCYARRYSGMLARDESWWSHYVFSRKKGTIAVYMDGDGAAKGYAIYQVKQRKLEIYEWVFLDEAARRELWLFFARHDSMADKLTVKLPVSDPMPFLLQNPRVKQETVPYFMARITDAAAFLEQYPFPANGTARRLLLKVADSFAAWNEGIFMVTVNPEGRAQVERLNSADGLSGNGRPGQDNGGGLGILEESNVQVPVQAACDIQTLTALLLGYQRPGLLAQIGRLQADASAVRLLEELVPPVNTYLADFF